MDGITYTEAFIGLVVASAIMWASVFAFAYSRRPFGGSARNYYLAFAVTWFSTVAFLFILTVWENQSAA
jgi:hypothetical protein